jgi:hypothetical protein
VHFPAIISYKYFFLIYVVQYTEQQLSLLNYPCWPRKPFELVFLHKFAMEGYHAGESNRDCNTATYLLGHAVPPYFLFQVSKDRFEAALYFFTKTVLIAQTKLHLVYDSGLRGRGGGMRLLPQCRPILFNKLLMFQLHIFKMWWINLRHRYIILYNILMYNHYACFKTIFYAS